MADFSLMLAHKVAKLVLLNYFKRSPYLWASFIRVFCHKDLSKIAKSDNTGLSPFSFILLMAAQCNYGIKDSVSAQQNEEALTAIT